MAAHLKPLPRCQDCGNPASEALCDTWNAEIGRYCSRHAKAALRRFQRDREATG